MRPEFRYFKCALSVEPIKSLDEQWRKDRELRDKKLDAIFDTIPCLLYTSPSPRDRQKSRMPSSA